MSILEEDVQRVREQTDIVAVISARLQLRRVGQRFVGLCPFHGEKTPSFSVNAVDGWYYCFGCRATGDAITFVRETEHVDFVGAVEILAAKAGIQLRYTSDGESSKRRERKHRMDLLEQATEWYHQRLRTAPDASPARRYLRSRGFDSEMVATYRLGWAPDGWDALCTALRLKAADADAVGLGLVNRAGRLQDFFRGRILFPISDDQGRPLAFGGRKLPDSDGPKYQNSKENALYHKSQTLYGLHWAKSDIVQHDQVIVCEGYTDVIGFHRAGIRRAVATCGTALTEEHLKVLQRFTSRVLLAYDADAAGQAAAERVYAWERSLGLEVSVMWIPSGQDPDELSRTDPDLLRQRVEEARPFLAFRVDRALLDANLSSPESRLRAAEPALAVVAEHPDPTVRRAYVDDVATRVRADPDDLAVVLDRLIASGGASRSPKAGDARGASSGSSDGDDPPPWVGRSASEFADVMPSRGPAQRAPGRRGRKMPIPAEMMALRLVVERPELAGFFDPLLFRHPLAHSAFLLVSEHGSLPAAVEGAPTDEVRDLLFAASSGGVVAGDALGAGREFELPHPRQIRHELVLLVASAEAQQLSKTAGDSDDLAAYVEVLSWLGAWVQRLRTAINEDDETAATESADALLAWLVEHNEPLLLAAPAIDSGVEEPVEDALSDGRE